MLELSPCNHKYMKNQTGQTLIEVVVATGMVVMVMVALVSGVVMSVANNRTAKERAVATRLSQEGMEWARAWREKIGWQPFVEIVLDGASEQTYCLNTLAANEADLQAITPGVCGSQLITGTIYHREIEFTINGTALDVTVATIWNASGADKNVTLTQTLYQGTE
jgi:Tfp pilus assembly protein PilV